MNNKSSQAQVRPPPKMIVLRTLERLLRKAKPGLRLNEHIDESGDINRRLAVLARRSNRALR